MFEEMNTNPEGAHERMEKHLIDPAKYQFHQLNAGKTFDWAAAKAMRPLFAKAFSNPTHAVCELIESGNRVHVRVLFTGVHTGDLTLPGVGTIPASNKPFHAYSSITYHFGCDGKIHEVFMIGTLVDALRAAAATPTAK